jgi:anaerobic magnesium-protoporphyrin IX monomethyl ester cyclase
MRVAFAIAPGPAEPQPSVPLAALSAAALLREAGHEVSLLDAALERLAPEAASEALLRLDPRMIVLGAGSAAWARARRMAVALRAAGFSGTLVAAGPHAELFPEHALAESRVDAAVLAEGEEALVELAARLVAAGALPSGLAIDGLAVRDAAGRAAAGRPRATSRDLDALPEPAWDLVEPARYPPPSFGTRGRPAIPMQLSRGCAFHRCGECRRAGRVKTRSRRPDPRRAAERAAAAARRLGAREIVFVDHDFVVGRDWAQDFCGAFRAEKLDISWTCTVRPNQVDRGLFHVLREAGCHQVVLRAELLDNERMRALDKESTVAQVADAVREAHKEDLAVVGRFTVGLPGTGPGEVAATVEHSVSQGFDVAIFSLWRPWPGTKGWQELGMTAEGLVEALGHPGRALVPPASRFRDAADVERAFHAAWRHFYGDPRTVARAARRALADPAVLRGTLPLAARAARQAIPDLVGLPAAPGRR